MSTEPLDPATRNALAQLAARYNWQLRGDSGRAVSTVHQLAADEIARLLDARIRETILWLRECLAQTETERDAAVMCHEDDIDALEQLRERAGRLAEAVRGVTDAFEECTGDYAKAVAKDDLTTARELLGEWDMSNQ